MAESATPLIVALAVAVPALLLLAVAAYALAIDKILSAPRSELRWDDDPKYPEWRR